MGSVESLGVESLGVGSRTIRNIGIERTDVAMFTAAGATGSVEQTVEKVQGVERLRELEQKERAKRCTTGPLDSPNSLHFLNSSTISTVS
jgi:hypothetical protein